MKVRVELTEEQAKLIYNAMWVVDPSGSGDAAIVAMEVCRQTYAQGMRKDVLTDHALTRKLQEAAQK